jgi:DNA-binding NarL/FixJ family response regulator
MSLSVFIVDDHPVVRKGFMTCWKSLSILRVVGEAASRTGSAPG